MVSLSPEASLRSYELDQLVRERTAGKGYTPAPQWSLCTHCAQPVSSRDSVVIRRDEHGQHHVRHAGCR